MTNERSRDQRIESPLGQLERALIDEHLRARGHDPAGLAALPEEERDALLTEASIYASGRLTEVEARSRFLDELHDGAPGADRTGLE